MKKLQFILFSLFVIGCTDDAIQQQLSQLTNLVDSVPEQALTILDSMREESADAPASYRMRIELAYANARNKINIPFTSTEEMQALSNYFDAHGSANEKLLAHYLLGLSFFDTHDAPRAIHSFIDAIEQADTSDADCNFRQLSIVWAQIANVYYYQGLYEEQLSAIDSSVKYALIAGDTLRAVTHLEQKANAYFALNNADSVIWICEQVADEYEKAGRKDLKAMALGFCVDKVIEKGNYVKARQYLSYYDAYSGLVDSCGNIEKGREIYYYFKGRYYAAVGMADSAEYFFRKEMREGPDPNNQNAASHGLANLFQQQHKPDSAARYALYSYTMNDSTYRQSTAAEVKRVQALYNYSHYQSIASKKQAEVHSLSQKISTCTVEKVTED